MNMRPFFLHRYDFWSMPQEDKDAGVTRTAEEQVEFKEMLSMVNLLYLGASVLILLDMSYLSRFWTCYEAWLSMQRATEDGLQPDPDNKRSWHVCIHAAEGVKDQLTSALVSLWGNKSTEQALELLRFPDLTVTNQRGASPRLSPSRAQLLPMLFASPCTRGQSGAAQKGG